MNFLYVEKFPDVVYCDFSEEFINFRPPTHLQAPVTVFLPAREGKGTPGGKPPSFVKLKPFLLFFSGESGVFAVLGCKFIWPGLVLFGLVSWQIWPGVCTSFPGNSSINLLRSNSQNPHAPSPSQIQTEPADITC